MSKESRHQRNTKKKPQMTLKERRAKKHEKQRSREIHQVEDIHPHE